ncbi:MAG: GNAT family N-acetyltransferase [Rhodospirillales bacterium]|nr:GNAT family N-acetyltransferase [Acetobacter sp.]
MMLQTPLGATLPIPFNGKVHRHERSFLQLNCDGVSKLPSVVPSYRVHFVPWAERYLEDMAHLVSAAYRGHIDSEINDQYRSIPGARQFLTNIIRYPGCGRFSPHSSLLAIDGQTGKVCGMCLASQISATSGHVTQLCILPALRHVRLGYELLRQSILRLKHDGCDTVSLTVTCANVEALRLYRSVGFRGLATFPALVWERV